ncbi:hypothetical protein ACFQZ4_13150 [Catellatospora coxensis]
MSRAFQTYSSPTMRLKLSNPTNSYAGDSPCQSVIAIRNDWAYGDTTK